MFRTAASLLFLALTVPHQAAAHADVDAPAFSNILRLAQIDTALVVQSRAVARRLSGRPTRKASASTSAAMVRRRPLQAHL